MEFEFIKILTNNKTNSFRKILSFQNIGERGILLREKVERRNSWENAKLDVDAEAKCEFRSRDQIWATHFYGNTPWIPAHASPDNLPKLDHLLRKHPTILICSNSITSTKNNTFLSVINLP